MKILIVLLIALAALPGQAQVVEVRPPNPTSSDRIYLTIATPYLGFDLSGITISGSVVEITFRNPSEEPSFGRQVVRLSPLPAGTYTINVRFVFCDDCDSCTAVLPYVLVVTQGLSPAFIPALSPLSLAMLAAAIAITGAAVLRRFV